MGKPVTCGAQRPLIAEIRAVPQVEQSPSGLGREIMRQAIVINDQLRPSSRAGPQ